MKNLLVHFSPILALRAPLFSITTGGIVFFAPATFSQEETLLFQSNSASINAPSDGLYFADILVRGRPIFQVGSLAEVSASERAKIINRRIAGILAQPNPEDSDETG